MHQWFASLFAGDSWLIRGQAEEKHLDKRWGSAFTRHLLPTSVTMQLADNYSHFVEGSSAGVIVVLDRKDRMKGNESDNHTKKQITGKNKEHSICIDNKNNKVWDIQKGVRRQRL